MTERLDTHYWVTAYLRRLSIENVPAYVRHRGDPHRGSVLLKIVHTPSETCRVLTEITDIEGRAAWMIAGADGCSETDADEYVARARKRDPDLWVIEIEDALAAHPKDGKILR